MLLSTCDVRDDTCAFYGAAHALVSYTSVGNHGMIAIDIDISVVNRRAGLSQNGTCVVNR
jgi:hypothetical protein